MAVSRRGAHPASTVITLGLLGAVIASVWTVSTLINRTVPEPYLVGYKSTQTSGSCSSLGRDLSHTPGTKVLRWKMAGMG